jgi:hypothetical protein
MVRFYNWSLRIIVAGAVALTCFARVNFYPKAAKAPAGMVAAIAGACPSGWSEYTAARGRYVVGVPAGGAVEATVGTELSNMENRDVAKHAHGWSGSTSHTHTADLSHTHTLDPWATANVTVLSGSTGPYPQQGSTTQNTNDAYPTWSISSSEEITQTGVTGTYTGTIAPYIQLRLCKKD